MGMGGSHLIKLESTGKKLKELVSKMKTKVNFNKSQTFKIYNLITKSSIVTYKNKFTLKLNEVWYTVSELFCLMLMKDHEWLAISPKPLNWEPWPLTEKYFLNQVKFW